MDKPLKDIRLFESESAPQGNKGMPSYVSEIFNFPKEAISLGQRIAMKCEELRISIGRPDHLYLCFTPSLLSMQIEDTSYAVEPWHKFILCGLSRSFNHLSYSEKLDVITQAIFKALTFIAPSQEAKLASIQEDLLRHGESLRVCLLQKTTKKYEVVVEITVPPHPLPTPIFVRITDLSNQLSGEVKAAEVKFYDEAPFLVDRIAIKGNILTIHPRKSFRASLYTKEYKVPLEIDLSEVAYV